jgi:hypothetical protein
MKRQETSMKGVKDMDKEDIVETCKYCNEKLAKNEFYYIYRLLVATDKQLHYIGIQKLLEELSNFAMEKSYHLSASQILLLRPDVVKCFLSQKLEGEKPLFWFLQESEICYTCFTENYTDIVPLR